MMWLLGNIAFGIGWIVGGIKWYRRWGLLWRCPESSIGVPLIDGSGNQLGVLRAAIETTRVLIESQTSLLVACGAGMSRSPAIVAAAMAMIDGITLAEALGKMVAQQPHDVSPSLLGEISEIVAGDFGADGDESDRGSQP
jgi:hypothetical protein